MAFNPGQKVIWIQAEIDPRKSAIREGEVVKQKGREEVTIVGSIYPMLAAFIYPDTEEYRSVLMARIRMSIRHEKENNEMTKKFYKMMNQQTRNGER